MIKILYSIKITIIIDPTHHTFAVLILFSFVFHKMQQILSPLSINQGFYLHVPYDDKLSIVVIITKNYKGWQER